MERDFSFCENKNQAKANVAAAKVLDVDTQDIRLARLKELIDKRFNGRQTDLGLACGISLSQIGQWLGSSRRIGEKSARKIERALGLPHLWMDYLNEIRRGLEAEKKLVAAEKEAPYFTESRREIESLTNKLKQLSPQQVVKLEIFIESIIEKD